MLRKWVTVVVCAVGAATAARAANWITVWETGGGTYTLDQYQRKVVITSGGAFKIQATGDFGGLGNIDSITVASGVTGAVDVCILRKPKEGGGPGAYDVKVFNLTGGQATTTIVEAQVAHDLGYSGATRATRAGTLTIGNDVLNNIEITQDIGGLTVRGTLSADVSCHTLGDTLIVQLDGGSLVCDNLGHLTIGDAEHLSHSGNVSVNASVGLNRHIYVYGSLNGYIDIAHGGITDLGRIETTRDLGSVISHGLLSSHSQIVVGRDLGALNVTGGASGAIYGDVEITGDLGTLTVSGEVGSDDVHITGNANLVHTDGPLSGYVEVGGTVNQLEIFGDLTGTFWGSGDVNSASVLNVRATGRLHSDKLLNSATIWTYVEQGGLVDAESIVGLHVHSGMFGTIHATSTLSQSAFEGVLEPGIVEAGTIGALTFEFMSGGTLDAGQVVGPANLGFLQYPAVVDVETVSGTLTVTEVQDSALVDVENVVGRLEIGSVAVGGLVDVVTLPGTLAISDLAGELDVQQDVSGEIILPAVGGGGRNGDLTGSLHVFGSVSGSIFVGGSIQGSGSVVVDGVLDDVSANQTGGHIIVNHALRDQASIVVSTSFDIDTEFIAVRYYGYADNDDFSDPWDPNAHVIINSETCHGPRPDLNVRKIFCKADCNDDGIVDYDDIDPFVTILTDQAGYAEAFPGLGASATFVADMDCNDVVGFSDVNPFVARISCDPAYCSPECGSCGGDMLTSQQLAAGMRAHEPAARLPALRAFVAQVIAHHQAHGEMQQRAYWAQVLAHLNQ